METLLHTVEELQRLAADLAHGVSDIQRYEDDAELFFTRLENDVADNFPALGNFMHSRLGVARSSMGYLLRGQGDLERHHILVTRNLSALYQSLKNPPRAPEDDEETAPTPYFS